ISARGHLPPRARRVRAGVRARLYGCGLQYHQRGERTALRFSPGLQLPAAAARPGAAADDAMNRARVRFVVWCAAVACLFAGQMVWMALLRGPRVMRSDGVLIGGQIALGTIVLLIAFLLRTTPAGAIRLPRHMSEAVILIGAAALQFAAVALLRPALSEDVLRYRIDGRMWLAGVSPYATAPTDFAQRDAGDSLA